MKILLSDLMQTIFAMKREGEKSALKFALYVKSAHVERQPSKMATPAKEKIWYQNRN